MIFADPNSPASPAMLSKSASLALAWASRGWFLLAFAGQMLFALYICFEFGAQLWAGDFALFKQPNFHGQAYGGPNNLILLAHVLLAAFLNCFGMLQLIPKLRKKMPWFHRWNGRLFLSFGLVTAVGGLYLAWGASARMSNTGAIGITFNGILIVMFALIAWHFARIKQFSQHRRMAVHAFMLVSGVWFFRLFLASWYLITQGGFGNSENLDGPADIAISFACYLLPMALAEAYFWAERQHTAAAKWGVAALIGLSSLLMAFGTVAATMIFWSRAFN
jgi:hypothetical protein